MVEQGSTVRVTRSLVLGTLIALAVAAVCVRLGIWQLHRLKERKSANAAVEARMAEPAARLTGMPRDTVGLIFRRVTMTGVYDTAHSVVIAGRSWEGAPGVHLLTPLRITGGGAVLVNRGWLPSADAATVELAPYDTVGEITVRGLVLPLDLEGGATYAGPPSTDGFRRVWYAYEDAIRDQFPYPVASVYVQALPDERPVDFRHVGPPELPARLPPPALSNGPHLGYAVQWFGFATVTLVGWGFLVARSGSMRVRLPDGDDGSPERRPG